MEGNVAKFIEDLKIFDIFSSAIDAKDTATIIRMFPQLANHDYYLNGKPSPKLYDQLPNYALITTTDSLTFKISSDGKIVDSFGVISSKNAEKTIIALDGTPRDRLGNSDIEYMNFLNDQIKDLEREKERKTKAAKYKAQGVALISSQLTSDGKGAKGVKFTALNTSNKTAKYIIMEVVGYNSVDDPVWSKGYLKRCRGIGPVSPNHSGTWDFNEIWEKGDIVESYEIKKLIIEYTDGTSKSVKLPQELPSGWRDWLY